MGCYHLMTSKPKVFRERFQKQNPSWPKKDLVREVKKYVAPWQGKYASGHFTGGAVDLRLWQNGRKVAMRSNHLTYQENALSFQPKLPKYLQQNRRLMFSALKKYGFANNSLEWWHWSHGDVYWAKYKNKKRAIYGPVFNP